MANNEHINKVVKSTGETLIDLTSDTVTAGTLLKDVTAHDRSGAQIEGTAVIPTVNDGTLTIQQNGTTKATFTANQAGNVTANIDALATNATVTLSGATTGTSNFNNNVVTIGTKRKSCFVGNYSGTLSARPYYKVASLKGSLEPSQNYRLALYVQRTLSSNGAGFGILDIDIRTEAGPVVGRMDAKWLISASGINPEDFILVHDKTAGSLDIYCKCYNAWKLYRFVVLSESKNSVEADNSNAWTLYNDNSYYNVNAGIAELPTGDNITTVYSKIADTHLSTARFKVEPNAAKTEVYMLSPNGDNGIYADIRDATTILQFACGQASNANGKVVFLGDRFYGGIGNPTSDSNNHFKFNDDCVGDSIGKLSSGSPLTGSEFDLNYETINLKGSTINIDDNMSMVFETENGFTVNTINSPYMVINTDGISLLPKTPNQFALLISGLPSGAGSEIVIGANGDVYKSSSSRDIKHEIQYIENTESYHDALMQIKPATYKYNNDKTETTKLGMIAEDIADVMPIAALTGEGGKVENYDTRAIIAMLVMEVQRLNAEIERLRGDNNAD